MLERARVEGNKLFDDTSGALENFHSIPGWQSIDLAELVAELVEERIANGNTEFSQAINSMLKNPVGGSDLY